MIAIRCALCGKNNSKEIFAANFNLDKLDHRTFSARRLPDKIHYRMVRCNKCDLLYSNPILSEEKIISLYRGSTITYGDYTENLNNTYQKHFKEALRLLQTNSKHKKLLEIGCGNGFFLKKALQLGIDEVWGVEPGQAAVAKAPKEIKKNIIVDRFRTGLFRANFFDVICIFQTLDHLVDPNLALEECHRMIKKGGILLVVVHDSKSWSARLLGERSPIIDIEHIYLFDKKNLTKILQKNKFKVLNTFSIKNLHAIGYWIYLAPIPLVIKQELRKILSWLRVDTLSIEISIGNIGSMGRK